MPVKLHNPKWTPKDVQMFLQASAHALTVIMKTNLINDIIYHFHTWGSHEAHQNVPFYIA